MRFAGFVITLAAAASVPAFSAAAQSATNASPRPAPCSRAEHRQFDFWIGEWEVTRPDGRPAGTNRIRAIHGGCALQEDWVGSGGSTGTSINAFDPATGRWHQTWVGNDGLVLRIDGGLKNGAMELTGVTTGVGGAQTLQRIRWTSLGGTPSRVRQLWEASTDGGRTWTVVFDGMYRRR